jgi:hypothetical protein
MSLDATVHLAAQCLAVVMAAHPEPEGKGGTVRREETTVVRPAGGQHVVLRRLKRSSMLRWKTTGVVERRIMVLTSHLGLLRRLLLPKSQEILKWQNRCLVTVNSGWCIGFHHSRLY